MNKFEREVVLSGFEWVLAGLLCISLYFSFYVSAWLVVGLMAMGLGAVMILLRNRFIALLRKKSRGAK